MKVSPWWAAPWKPPRPRRPLLEVASLHRSDDGGYQAAEAGVVDQHECVLPDPLECRLVVEVDRRDGARPRQLLGHHVPAQLR